MVSSGISTDARANISYFSSDAKFNLEKPYTTSFPVDDIAGASVSNHEWTQVEGAIRDLREHDLSPQLDSHGFTILPSKTTMTFDDFKSRDIVEERYFPELASLMQQHFPQYKTFAFFDYAIRKRSPLYPQAKGASTENEQPFWRVLKGPNSDWPLAFCDSNSTDHVRDTIPNDVVYRGGLGETAFLRENGSHKWYYISHQMVDDIFLWRNTDFPGGKLPRAFHAAFENPLSGPEDGLRESVEVRFAAFR
ncbi:hypothetical protein DL98DRAFT_553444 [Cadophora sp. DSE1049]|nr:hypothetical protein DL98DRAFT_553444 [Cadophora sp. DSE1049]